MPFRHRTRSSGTISRLCTRTVTKVSKGEARTDEYQQSRPSRPSRVPLEAPKQNGRSRSSSRSSGSGTGSGSSDISASDQQETYDINFPRRNCMSSDGSFHNDEQTYGCMDSKMV